MVELNDKSYIAIVQCHIVKEYCSGFYCEKSFSDRSGGFAAYPAGQDYRYVNLTCGGCCGRALQRKLINLRNNLSKRDKIGKERLVVQFSSCVTRDNHHGPACPHLDYLKTLVDKLGIDWLEDTHISNRAQEKRESGEYRQ